MNTLVSLARSIVPRRTGPRDPPPPFALPIWIALVAVSVVIFWVSVPVLVGFYQVPVGLAFGVATVQCATIPLAVRLPRTSLLLQLGTVVFLGAATTFRIEEYWPLSVPALLALTSVLVVLGLRERWTLSVAAWWVSFFILVIVVVLFNATGRSSGAWGINVLASITVTLVALTTSVAIGQRHRVRLLLAEAARDIELEQALRLGAEERARIARELHDVVAHSMSIVHIQAESAQYRVADLDPAAAREFADIARSARSALGEMRQLLGALRPGDGSPDLAPQPVIADIPGLIENASKVGTFVTLTCSSDLDAVSPIIQLTIYRIVQEALSNAVRHAPRAPTRVRIETDADSVTVVIENDKAPNSLHLSVKPEVGGNGLRGMRERVALLNGTFTHGAIEPGGFRISAVIPTHLERSEETI